MATETGISVACLGRAAYSSDGAAFYTSGDVESNTNVTFIIDFTPCDRSRSAGINVNLDTGVQTIPLSGQGTGPSFSVSNVTSGGTIQTNGKLSFHDTALGKTAAITLSVTNTSSAVENIPLSVVGADFALPNGVTQLNLNPGDSKTFNVVFTVDIEVLLRPAS